MAELIEPYKKYDSKIREVYAQEPTHPVLDDLHLNVTPVFTGQEANIKIRARNLDAETDEEKEKYLMPLETEKRRPSGAPAVVQSLKEFQTNFNIFSESSLVDMDWSNVVAAGSSVVTSLLPVPEKYSGSKRALRQYYHEVIAPASDVDLFIYGLSEEQAIEKIKSIEKKVKDSILAETTTIRTKHAITIASQYPTRHVQIVLRIYKSLAEILTGFDVDCSCAAYTGSQVYASPRALAAYMTQTNTIDLTRRSPSYENRLSKYSHRGFEVHWPQLDRSKIDPTIFERNFGRTLGLARLLVLEKLPNSSDRDDYMDQRRRERGRPAINRWARTAGRFLKGNIKDKYEDEVAEWVEEDEVADYHTFTVPYGEKFHARKIEKLLYTKDLLLNAEWNKPKDREVNLHRHPAFFGDAEDVFYDCCGYCPKPETPEEEEVAEEESKIYVSGKISFIKDDPGRQTIGSFNPLTDDDWTEMAYVADGRTALHLAAARGSAEIVRILLRRSEANEEEEAKKVELRRQARLAAKKNGADLPTSKDTSDVEMASDEEDAEMIDADEDDDVDMKSTTTGSYIKVKKDEEQQEGDNLPEDDEDEPDVYDINVLAWDTPSSALHLAIFNGHCDALLKNGADPNALTTQSWQLVQENYAYVIDHGSSLLDLVRQKVKELRKYDDSVDLTPPEPEFEGSGEDFINAYENGSYQQWVAVKAVQKTLQNYTNAMKSHAKSVENAKERKGIREKREAVDKLLKEFEEVEKELVAKAAKTFVQLHPDVNPRKHHSRGSHRHSDQNVKKQPWKVQFNFRVPDLTETKRDGYIRLFEAAWKGDLLAIKRLTLTFWGELRDQFPLKIAVENSDGYSPFQIAVLRGHLDCARGILEIAKAQYKPREKSGQERYTMDEEDSDYESSQASEASEDEDDIKVFKEIIDDQFTIENIGEVATQVRSTVSPLAFLDWGCSIPRTEMDKPKSSVIGLASHPTAGEWQYARSGNLVQYAIERDDLDLLNTLLQWGAEYTAQYNKPDGEDSIVPFYTRGVDDLTFAMRLGRTRCLGELIKQTGVGLPLDKLIKRSGVEIVEKPKYYQGLSIHGKKRADWALAGRGESLPRASNDHPPLLQAALEGNLESIEWFLSDAPIRCYAEFAEKNKDDKRLKHLAKANGGIQRAISDWLDLRQKLVLHCAIIGPWKSDETPKILNYLMSALPKTLETKASSTGQTPLHLAFSLGRYVTAKKLIAAGADQTCRDSSWCNIIHALLSSGWGRKPAELFKMLELVDKRLIPSLFRERNSEAATPLSNWLRSQANGDDGPILEHLLSLSQNLEELEMVDGAGDTPLHIVTKRELPRLMRIILDKRPELLYRENSTGRTPAEMVADTWTSKCFESPPRIPKDPQQGYHWHSGGTQDPLVHRAPERFLPKDTNEEKNSLSAVWALCRERMQKDSEAGGAKRKLVSLNEANEVARRLGKRQKTNFRTRRVRPNEEFDGEEEDDPKDEIACWNGPRWCEFKYDEDGELLQEQD
ncbi:putative ankyrin repeat protein [Neofusicoccum parvum UCRNP2]|uniref:Putative ankyrin repeat protein n=1 Tax=Botryosphaeria parva (strain UCR-NP2) TaxID=1287680 RepID=R1EE75_BOTPV|nr:putative ankyrin repeat protein [Neofusicoccum parvum UCRNP2]